MYRTVPTVYEFYENKYNFPQNTLLVGWVECTKIKNKEYNFAFKLKWVGFVVV